MQHKCDPLCSPGGLQAEGKCIGEEEQEQEGAGRCHKGWGASYLQTGRARQGRLQTRLLPAARRLEERGETRGEHKKGGHTCGGRDMVAEEVSIQQRRPPLYLLTNGGFHRPHPLPGEGRKGHIGALESLTPTPTNAKALLAPPPWLPSTTAPYDYVWRSKVCPWMERSGLQGYMLRLQRSKARDCHPLAGA